MHVSGFGGARWSNAPELICSVAPRQPRLDGGLPIRLAAPYAFYIAKQINAPLADSKAACYGLDIFAKIT